MHLSFEFIFLFNHSNGHDRIQPNGLLLNKIKMRYAGKQPFMHSSQITADLLGPFHTVNSLLQADMYQSMTYTDSDPGPCYFLSSQKEKFCNDIVTNTCKETDLMVAEMTAHLKVLGTTELLGTKDKLQKICQNKNIPTKCVETKIIKGWAQKQKGAHQILFECGWIDPLNINKYTEHDKKTDSECDGNDLTGCIFSLKELMKKQRDFAEETTLLQYYGNKLGVVVDRTPKCHPELAGEGIEYMWAVAKLVHYRKAPISEKRTKANFKKLVEE